MAKRKSKKRGPQGGVKHTPGRGHNRKSADEKKRRFAEKAAQKRRQRQEVAKKAWDEWDRLPEDVKKLLGPTAQPQVPRPRDE